MVTTKNQKSRLHDEKGNLISMRNFVLHFFPALSSNVGRILFNYRPQLPWLAYSALNELKVHLNKNSIVLEFGSGMSTVWFSKHVKHIYSVEDNEEWFQKVLSIIKSKNIKNITYASLSNEDYINYLSDENIKFDFILVDGSFRDKCVQNAISRLNKGGIIYLDNSDKYPNIHLTEIIPKVGNIRLAEKTILNYAKEKHATIQYYTDFAPTQLFVQQGLMMKLP